MTRRSAAERYLDEQVEKSMAPFRAALAAKESEQPPIPISAAKDIAHKYDYDQIIVIGRNTTTGFEHVTTYGKTKAHCGAAAKIGDFLKYDIMKWPREG